MALPPRHPRARSISRLVASALVALVATGCSLVPRADPLAGPQAIASCAGSSALTTPVDLPASLVPGLTIHTQSDEATYVHAATPVIPGATGLNAHLAQALAGELNRYRADLTQSAAAGITGAGELNISWNLVGVSDRAVGVMLTGRRTVGSRSASSVQLVWWDVADHRLLTPTDFFTSGGWSELTSRLTTDLCAGDAARGPLLTRALANPTQLAVAFAGDGSAVLSVNSSTSAPVGVVLDAHQVLPWLSAVGRAAAESATHPQLVRLTAPTPLPPATSGPSPGPAATKPQSQAAQKSARTKPPAAKHEPAQRKTARVDCRRVRCVALTFDDGPGPYTADLVAKLRAARAPATFFMMGEHVDAFPSLADQVSRAGFEIGNHSYSHPDLTRLSAAEVHRQLSHTSDSIQRATGRRPTVMRPPYGARNARVDQVATQVGLTEVLWDVDTLDWQHHDAAVVRQSALRDTRRGSIVLLHDIHPTTVQAVPSLVKDLRARGYTLVSVSELLGSTTPGSRHFRAG